ncbi:MAG: (2Fe-2S)-binding protein [bacterium]
MSRKVVTLNINGSNYESAIREYDVLLDVIRENLNLTGTKRGCDMGTCGCCAVLIDGRAKLSCLTLAMECLDKKIVTIEGLKSPVIHPLQRAFAESGGSQCGFCTQGFIITAKALLDENANPTREEIEEAISGNMCRCTGYIKIIDAIENAASDIRRERA